MKRFVWNQFIVRVIFTIMVLSAIFVAIEIRLAPIVAPEDVAGVRIKSDYALMFVQCILGVVAMTLPGMVERRWHLAIPSRMILLYAVFLFCAIYLGEVRAFYYNVPHWDTILHTFSGAMLGALGFSFITLFNNAEWNELHLTPIFVAAFTFCFAVALGVVWEIYEFSMDSLLRTNMQKFALEDGTALVGQVALADTMKDLIVDAVGGLVMSIIGYISLKYKKGWTEQMLVRFKEEDDASCIDEVEDEGNEAHETDEADDKVSV